MKKHSSNTIQKVNKLKIVPFSKLKYLRVRWEEPNLTLKNIREYNLWSSEQRYKIIMFELMLEHYLTKNIIVDMNGKDDLFKEENLNLYFSSRSRRDKIFIGVIKYVKNKNKGSIPSVEYMKELDFGKKLIIWKGLKKNIFKNKFMGIKTQNQKALIASLDNIRNVRNGIAHMNSKAQTLNAMKYIWVNKVEKTKIQLYKDSLKLCNKIGTKPEGDKNE